METDNATHFHYIKSLTVTATLYYKVVYEYE